MQIKVGAAQILADVTLFFTTPDCRPDPLDRQGIFGPNVKYRFVGSHRSRRDGHSFDHSIRKRLEQHAVHECAGIPLIAVADNVLRVTGGLPGFLPLDVRGKTGPAPPP